MKTCGFACFLQVELFHTVFYSECFECWIVHCAIYHWITNISIFDKIFAIFGKMCTLGKDGKDGTKGEKGSPGEPGSLGPRGLE